MKKIRFCVLWIALVGTCTVHADWNLWNVNEAIPDNDPTGLQDTREISSFQPGYHITALEVSLTISAASGDTAWNGDFFVSLQHDTGYAVLLNRVGRTASALWGYDHNGFDITFVIDGNDVHQYQDHAPSYDGNGRLTGAWGVDGRTTDPDSVLDTDVRTDMLTSFNNLNPNGSWTLFVADVNQNSTATLDTWGLHITAIPEPGTLGLLLTAGGALLLLRRRRPVK